MENININYLKKKLDKVEIKLVEKIDSTMNIEHFRDFVSKKNLLIANEQTNGVGRYGRHFVSPAKTGLYFTYRINCEILQEDIFKLTPIAGVALSKAIEKNTGKMVEIKWLNDIYINKYKVAGILVRINEFSSNKADILIGIGINIFKNSIYDNILSNKVSSIYDKKCENILIKEMILTDFIKIFDNLILDIKNKEQVDYYNKHILYRNKSINFIINGEKIMNGKLLGVDDNYKLIVKTTDKIRTFDDGEIRVTL